MPRGNGGGLPVGRRRRPGRPASGAPAAAGPVLPAGTRRGIAPMRSSCGQTARQSTSHRFLGNGMSCPLTALAVRYGAERGGGPGTLLPERITRHTFWFFGTPLRGRSRAASRPPARCHRLISQRESGPARLSSPGVTRPHRAVRGRRPVVARGRFLPPSPWPDPIPRGSLNKVLPGSAVMARVRCLTGVRRAARHRRPATAAQMLTRGAVIALNPLCADHLRPALQPAHVPVWMSACG
jgi:hypothetical protein